MLVTEDTSRPGSLPSINELVNTYGSCSTAEVSLTRVAVATTTSTQPAVVNVIQRWRRTRAGVVWPLMPRTKACRQAARVTAAHPPALTARSHVGKTDHTESVKASNHNHSNTPKPVTALPGSSEGYRHSRQIRYRRTGTKHTKTATRTVCMLCHSACVIMRRHTP
ncbi:Uncharacterised protein [Mycobacteroides abscessus subsp. abscessus]|nr:Uncharacterised protein [Mycobacteroides abscessus subsp. abscessus]